PGSPVTLTIQTKDEQGKPISAVLGITVTDEGILKMVDSREQHPHLPAMALLEHEVNELKDSHIYLNPQNPLSEKALDLLLGTQGWRRFAFLNYKSFIKRFGEKGKDILAYQNGNNPNHPFFLNKNLKERDFPLEGRILEKRKILPPQRAFAPKAERRAHINIIRVGKRERAPASAKLVMSKAKMISPEYFWRVYAHQSVPLEQTGQRNDFTKTIYWCSGIQTNSKGIAQIQFSTSHLITTFQISVDAFDSRGALGWAKSTIRSIKPFFIEPKMPLQVSSGDTIQLPIVFVNNTDKNLGEVFFKVQGAPNLQMGKIMPFLLRAGERKRKILTIQVGSKAGKYPLLFLAKQG
ncbi:MAG: hypothetical protein D6785_10325, partial [Planctomycetota bacterium]